MYCEKALIELIFSQARTDDLLHDDTQALLQEATVLLEGGSSKSSLLSRQSNIVELLISIDKKLDYLMQKVQNIKVAKKENDEESDFIWNGYNLKDIQARDANAYARALLEKLFTKEEQKRGILFQSKKSARTPLDPERVKLIFC
uniref:BEN domain-containing protein n=1 Tax=Amphimedon queenslandica TaxID=400682 RepID=A0A1X7VSV8_AMPQE